MADAGMIGSLVGGLLAGDGIVIPVGAIAVLIVGTGMRWGTRWVDHRGWGPPRSLRSLPSGGRDCPRGVRVAALVTGNLLILGLARRMALNR